jgi:hypothetical protein
MKTQSDSRDSVQGKQLDFRSRRGCARLNFTYIETDDIKRACLWVCRKNEVHLS